MATLTILFLIWTTLVVVYIGHLRQALHFYMGVELPRRRLILLVVPLAGVVLREVMRGLYLAVRRIDTEFLPSKRENYLMSTIFGETLSELAQKAQSDDSHLQIFDFEIYEKNVPTMQPDVSEVILPSGELFRYKVDVTLYEISTSHCLEGEADE